MSLPGLFAKVAARLIKDKHMQATTLSIIIPVYNEAETIITLLERLTKLTINIEVIVIDDSSTDTSRELIESFNYPNLRFLHHPKRLGKGAAIQTGLRAVTGDFVLIQDADLEYDPHDIVPLYELVANGDTNAAYGVRDFSRQKFIIRLGNRFLTWATNRIYSQSIRDMTTCYKMLPRSLIEQLKLKSNGFAIDAEITAKLFRAGASIREYPISYTPRYKNKKIKIRDGFPLLWALLRYRFWNGASYYPLIQHPAVDLVD